MAPSVQAVRSQSRAVSSSEVGDEAFAVGKNAAWDHPSPCAPGGLWKDRGCRAGGLRSRSWAVFVRMR
jgi:hypothetical protein